jgi:hypothetical protein
MASGRVNRTKRPNTWLHRPMLQTSRKLLLTRRPFQGLPFVESCTRIVVDRAHHRHHHCLPRSVATSSLARKRFRKRESNIACCGEMPFVGVIAKEVCYNLSKLADLCSGRRYTGPVPSHFSVFQDVSDTCNVAPTKSPLCRGIRLLIPRHIFRGCAAQWVKVVAADVAISK